MKRMFFIVLLVLLAMALSVTGCRKKPETNTVDDLEQFDADNANNYRYIFRDRIQEEEQEAKKRNRREWK